MKENEKGMRKVLTLADKDDKKKILLRLENPVEEKHG